MARFILLTFLTAVLSQPQGLPGPWKTDWSKKSIPISELVKSVEKDAIRSIDKPSFVSPAEASSWLAPREPVMVFEYQGEARAYPLQILLFHELVNDQIADLPFLVSFCPLCNSGLIFDRRVDGEVYEFGVAGLLRQSDMVMYDRQTESLWQQISGEALAGELTGSHLRLLTSPTVSFQTFRSAHPTGQVLSRDTGFAAPYGESLYVDHEFGRRDVMPVRLDQPLPVQPFERLLAVTIGGRSRAYPFRYLRQWGVLEGRIKKERFVVFFEPGMVSAMDKARVSASREVGAAGAFSPIAGGNRLKFHRKNGRILDKKTGSAWNALGHCVEGPLAGTKLKSVPHQMMFAFAWYAFHPETRMVGAEREVDLLSPASPAGGPGIRPGGPLPPR